MLILTFASPCWAAHVYEDAVAGSTLSALWTQEVASDHGELQYSPQKLCNRDYDDNDDDDGGLLVD